MEDKYYIHWLLSVPGIGRKRAAELINLVGSAEDIWKLDRLSLKEIYPKNPKLVESIASSKNEFLLKTQLDNMERLGVWLLSVYDHNYPAFLRDIYDPPLLIYGRGTMPDEELPKISVIGARKCTEYGLAVAYKFSRELSAAGFVVVSGLAEGIDAIAHRGAMDAFAEEERENRNVSSTIAVLGTGVDKCYPYSNLEIYNRILKNGCVISEYPPGTHLDKYTFPQRNRIISGLSHGVLVVEASEKSGTSITVRMAAEEGREIFVVPGSIFSELSKGTNNLIKGGATLVTSYEDIVFSLRYQIGHAKFISKRAVSRNVQDSIEHNINKNIPAKHSFSPEEERLYSNIGKNPVEVDLLVLKTGLAVQDVQSILFSMEIRGYIKKIAGQRYVKAV